MKRLFLSIVLVLVLVGGAAAANTVNPTTPKESDPGVDVTFDGSTAFDLGFPRLISYAEYIPAAAGNSLQIRNGSATATRVGYFKSIDGSPQIIPVYGPVRVYVKGDQVSNGDILILRFK